MSEINRKKYGKSFSNHDPPFDVHHCFITPNFNERATPWPRASILTTLKFSAEGDLHLLQILV